MTECKKRRSENIDLVTRIISRLIPEEDVPYHQSNNIRKDMVRSNMYQCVQAAELLVTFAENLKNWSFDGDEWGFFPNKKDKFGNLVKFKSDISILNLCPFIWREEIHPNIHIPDNLELRHYTKIIENPTITINEYCNYDWYNSEIKKGRSNNASTQKRFKKDYSQAKDKFEIQINKWKKENFKRKYTYVYWSKELLIKYLDAVDKRIEANYNRCCNKFPKQDIEYKKSVHSYLKIKYGKKDKYKGKNNKFKEI